VVEHFGHYPARPDIPAAPQNRALSAALQDAVTCRLKLVDDLIGAATT
jgi:hypothetical protein